MIRVNARFRCQRVTGVQRYASEICGRIAAEILEVVPTKGAEGVKGHLWEQFVLPRRIRGELLWNPCATGPLLSGRTVTTIHDLSFLDHPEWFTGKYGAWYRQLVPRLARRSEAIIAVSQFTKDRVVDLLGIPSERIVVIAEAPWQIVRDESSPSNVLESFGVRPVRYFLAAASLEPRKNLSALLEAWQRVRSELGQDLRLVVAGGKGISRVFSSSESCPADHAGVIFTGYVSDAELDELYRNALGFVYPSLYEGFGLPPLEAMSRGCPVITSNRTSIPEVAGGEALLIDPTSIDELAQGMLTLATDGALRERLSSGGLARAEQFSWEKAAKQTLDLLKSVAG